MQKFDICFLIKGAAGVKNTLYKSMVLFSAAPFCNLLIYRQYRRNIAPLLREPQSAEGVLDAPSFFGEAPVEAEWLLSVAAVGNDWLGSAILQPQTHLGAVGGLVADQAFRCFACGDEPLRDRAVMRFAAGQEDGEKTAPSICACMDLRVAPAS
jgi:hypothetical protein